MATYCVAKRIDGKKINDTIYLGKVIDKDHGIYQNRKQGKIIFSPELGIQSLPNETEIGIYDFGNVYALHEVLKNCGFINMLKEAFGNNFDGIAALVFYRILQGGANIYAVDWYDGSWAKSLFPNACLLSQRLSELTREIGNEQVIQRFFNTYLNIVLFTFIYEAAKIYHSDKKPPTKNCTPNE